MEAVFIPKNQIAVALSQEPKQGKRNLEPIHSWAKEQGVPFSLLEDYQVLNNEAEVHQKEADLWYCLEGEVEFICGGELVGPRVKKDKDGSENPHELRAGKISNGKSYTLRAGDWLWIPAGVPHVHSTKTSVRLAIIKIPKA